MPLILWQATKNEYGMLPGTQKNLFSRPALPIEPFAYMHTLMQMER
jgi:hypothetical protein